MVIGVESMEEIVKREKRGYRDTMLEMDDLRCFCKFREHFRMKRVEKDVYLKWTTTNIGRKSDQKKGRKSGDTKSRK